MTTAGLDDIYAKIRAVLFSSVWPEPLPYAGSETILKGRLIVASNIGGTPELLAGCRGAFLFEPGDSNQLAQQIEYVSNLTQEVAEDLVSQSRHALLSKFDDQTSLKQFFKICTRVMNT